MWSLQIQPRHDVAGCLGEPKVDRELGGLHSPTMQRQCSRRYDPNRIGEGGRYVRMTDPGRPSMRRGCRMNSHIQINPHCEQVGPE